MTTYKNFKIEFVSGNDMDLAIDELVGKIEYNPGGVLISGFFTKNDTGYNTYGFYPYHTIKVIGYETKED